MIYPAKRHWLIIWIATVLTIAVAGWDRWPALFQSPDERATYLRDKWNAERAAEGRVPDAFSTLIAIAERAAKPKSDILYIRVVASLGAGVVVALAIWQVLGRPRSS